VKQSLRFGHDDFDEHEQERHECGKFYEKGFRPAQKMAVESHALSFLAVRRKHAYPHEFGCILVSRIESMGVQSSSMVGNVRGWMRVTILVQVKAGEQSRILLEGLGSRIRIFKLGT
jgi:hypothetical protein